MSQYCGSNREGFNILQTSGRKSVRLDGLFNIISYDLVTKLQEDITQANFKVQKEIYLSGCQRYWCFYPRNITFLQIVIADEAHYLKNAQAKRTTACVPLVQVYYGSFIIDFFEVHGYTFPTLVSCSNLSCQIFCRNQSMPSF